MKIQKGKGIEQLCFFLIQCFNIFESVSASLIFFPMTVGRHSFPINVFLV